MAINAVLRSEGRRAVENGRVEAVRKAARLSQSELARALGVTQTAVALWERRERVPRGEAAERLASLLHDLEAAAA